jgi:rfaE bifunctional protein nucleotidyltransferase chain/domain
MLASTDPIIGGSSRGVSPSRPLPPVGSSTSTTSRGGILGQNRGMISDLPTLVLERRVWKAAGSRLAFTNGCFDLLHPGHLRLLEAARAEADLLVVGINSDRSVRILKGKGRPVVPEQERAETLAALECVDRVTIYDEETPAALISALVPDVLVKGADWAEDEIVGRDVVEEAGGRVIRVEILPGRSTSSLLERIRRS